MKFLQLYKFIIEQEGKLLVLLPGGFKPPHRGHFEALKYMLKTTGAKEAKIFVGKKERDGITQDQSLKIWNIYKKYIPANVDVVGVTGVDKGGRDATPLSMTYDFIQDNGNSYSQIYVGAGQDDLKRYEGLVKNKLKYPNAAIIAIPPQYGRISGTETRKNLSLKNNKMLQFIPEEVKEVDRIKYILGI
ncbi:MAG: hypothetical protein EBU90_11590 [Proteobacteria bacterium]|nr:hypothetical protein [Pseudomonadota bacterium]NBP14768.1 hypothetical protein [bacterium]